MNATRSWNLAIVATSLILGAFLFSAIAYTTGWHTGATGRVTGISALALIACGVWLHLSAVRFGPLEPESGTNAIHVLHWVPPYVGGEGTWELQDIASWEAGDPPVDPGWGMEDEARDIDANDFTEWIAGLVGYPVDVEKDFVRISCPAALRFWRREPVWWVWPACAAEVQP